jgi:isoquinoline 1-oxidoreductase subunit alpha
MHLGFRAIRKTATILVGGHPGNSLSKGIRSARMKACRIGPSSPMPRKAQLGWSSQRSRYQTLWCRAPPREIREDVMTVHFTVNGKPAAADVPPATPLLWVIREGLKLTGTKFGCGTGLCGACMVHIDGKRAFSCQTQVSEIAGKSVTTIEGLSPDSSHPLQTAWLAEQVPQCGYCQSGQIMSAADLLNQNPRPTRDQIVEHMSTNICRCGTYQRIVRAVERAAREV